MTALAAELRSATRIEHERAESMPFVGALMSGRAPLEAYVDLLGQHHAVYRALEAAEPFVRAQPGGAGLVFGELARTAAIERDLAALRGAGWRDAVRVLPATRRYVDRLHAVAGTWVGGYAVHAWTRYLGDLSGGLAIRAVLRRSYGLPDDALHFYTFPGIPRPKPFKDAYRARMDALDLGPAERARAAEEARLAFRLNVDVFADLAARHLTGPATPAAGPAAAAAATGTTRAAEPAGDVHPPAVSTAGSPAR